jgi:hypothetical protein
VALCLFLEILLRREPYGALGTSVTRVFALPLGKEAFAGPAVPSGLCRESPLGTGCAESIWACAEWSSLSGQPQIPVVGIVNWHTITDVIFLGLFLINKDLFGVSLHSDDTASLSNSSSLSEFRWQVTGHVLGV